MRLILLALAGYLAAFNGCASPVDHRTPRADGAPANRATGGGQHHPHNRIGDRTCEAGFSSSSHRQLSEFTRLARRSVVQIHSLSAGDGTETGRGGDVDVKATAARHGGSGVIVDDAGYILTAQHVVRHAQSVLVTMADGRRFTSTRIALHPRLDLALIRVAATDLPAVNLAQNDPDVGTSVVALCAARKDGPELMRPGRIARKNVSLQKVLPVSYERDYGHLIESTTSLEHGFSGGPLIDCHGRLVGINVAASGSAEGGVARGYALPLDAYTVRTIDGLRHLLAK